MRLYFILSMNKTHSIKLFIHLTQLMFSSHSGVKHPRKLQKIKLTKNCYCSSEQETIMKKSLKKVKKFSSRLMIGFAWYFCVGFFSMPKMPHETNIHDYIH
ncbi:CLUMA_CG008429, isoform A [Clunio marinus]|uniref:CLUMA_CG008429, isoform A n=1 Tax=Clunio marinus TaxID=568069 RepID=A0A1J1I5B1_9DIPT|nr:CLUMA_CG008429, isoform A [Clunio marinus]